MAVVQLRLLKSPFTAGVDPVDGKGGLAADGADWCVGKIRVGSVERESRTRDVAVQTDDRDR